jgi:hypothetical protein
MFLDYHLQLLLTWTVRILLWASLGVIFAMTSGCGHKFDINGTSSGTLTREPVAVDPTPK